MLGLILLILFKAGGLPLVNYTLYLPLNTTVINVSLPVVPIPDTIEAVNDSTGAPIPVSLYPNDTLVIFAFGGGYVSIMYYGNYTFNGKVLLYSFNVSSTTNVTIVFPPYVIPFNLPLSIVSYRIINGSTLVVTLPPGRYTIQYAYVPKGLLTSTTTTTPTTTASTTTTTMTTTSTSTSTSSITSSPTSTVTQTAVVTSSTTSSITTTSPQSTSTVTSTAPSTTSTSTSATRPPPVSNSVSPLYITVAVALIVIVSVVVMLSRRRAIEAVEDVTSMM
ncbi:MAG: hypothetical protein AT709_07345 [Caldivirga sp. MG_3]|nr:MAG: hypothetical protein AT709_07345 [Caldivirga sp. MG_3]